MHTLKKKKKLSLTFSLFHGNSRHCIPEVHVGCSSNKGSVLESPQLKTLSTLFFCTFFFLIYLVLYAFVGLYICTRTHPHTYCTQHCVSPYLALVQAHTPNSKITRQSTQVFLVSHKALTVPWSAGLLWYTRPLHTQTCARTHTHADLTSLHW